MIVLDCLAARNAWQQHLAAAAKAGQEMIDNAAACNDLVGLAGMAIEIYRRIAARCAHEFQVFSLLALVVNNFEAPDNFVAKQFSVLIVGHFAMRATGAKNCDVFVPYAAAIDGIQQKRRGNRGRFPQPCNIRHNQADLFSGMQNIFEFWRANRLPNGLAHGPGLADRWNIRLVGPDNSRYFGIIQIKDKTCLPIGHFYRGHKAPLLFKT